MTNKFNGFLHAEGRFFADGNGNIVQLKGAALGNWMLLEGYMWGFMTTDCNREWMIQRTFERLAGKEASDRFFPEYRKAFVTEGDIHRMAQIGFNSVRLPFNWKHFMHEGPGIRFKEEGFERLDEVIGWCRKHGLYAILDMHAAPGGQTGSNIDDGIDDVPRLFIDGDNRDKALELWKRIAERYKDETAVGGYDLLNEPLRPYRETAPVKDLDHLIPSLIRFYDECVKCIRSVDKNHLFSIEGAHWARDTRVFTHLYDPNMCIHFHAYWTQAHKALLEKYIALSEKFNVPLWLGETGENTLEWYTTLFPMLDENGISWNFWEWKKSIRRNSNYVIRQPEGWKQAIDFVLGGPHPGFKEGQRMLNEWLINCRFENCEEAPEVANAIMRRPGTAIPAISYMQTQHSFSPSPEREYRNGDGMRFLARFSATLEIDPSHAHGSSDVRWDHPWRVYDLLLEKDEFASYLIRPMKKEVQVRVLARALDKKTCLKFEIGGISAEISLERTIENRLYEAITIPCGMDEGELKVTCIKGAAAVESILI